jgi:hypothetical protein
MPTLQKSQPMVLRGWREAMLAPTTEKVSSRTRSETTLLSSVSPPEGRSGTADPVTRSKATPPKSSATDNVASDQESQTAARLPVLPTPWPRFFESLLTTPPLYKKIVSRPLRQPLRARRFGNFLGKGPRAPGQSRGWYEAVVRSNTGAVVSTSRKGEGMSRARPAPCGLPAMSD